MSALYLSTAPLIHDLELDATYQEILNLRKHFGGEILSLVPFKKPISWYPRQLFGRHNRGKLIAAAKRHDLVHVFASGMYDIPVLRSLQKHAPVIYTSLTNQFSDSFNDLVELDAVFLPSQEIIPSLNLTGFKNVHSYFPAIDIQPEQPTEINSAPLKKLHLLMASAPWNKDQFDTKGIFDLIEAAEKFDKLEITFLWRKIETPFMNELINRSSAKSRLHLIDRKVDIVERIKSCDAGILVAKDRTVIKSYPHSLIECQLLNKPVIISDNIEFSSLVNKWGSGISFNYSQSASVLNTIEKLFNNYQSICKNLVNVDKELFSESTYIQLHENVYKSLVPLS